MNLLHPKSLEDLVVHLLRKGEARTSTLLEEVREVRGATTKQGFYSALRKLKKEEVVTVNKGVASLHSAWIGEMRDEVEHIAEAYMVNPESFGVLNLQEKESISYTCSTPLQLDSFWGHTQAIIANAAPRGTPIIAYDPHYWFYLIRKKLEHRYYAEFERGAHQFLMVVGGDSALDRLIAQDFTGDFVQYHLASLGWKNTYYPATIGDFVIEVALDPRIAREIEEIYARHLTLSEALVRELQAVLHTKSKNKIKISRNKKRAQKLRGQLSKYFYIKPLSVPKPK